MSATVLQFPRKPTVRELSEFLSWTKYPDCDPAEYEREVELRVQMATAEQVLQTIERRKKMLRDELARLESR